MKSLHARRDYRKRFDWIRALLAAVIVDAIERLQKLGSADRHEQISARAALAWIRGNDDHPLGYVGACQILELNPKYGRRIARKLEQKARSPRPQQTARIGLCERIGPRADI